MSDFLFGMGPGFLPRKANTIAKKHGAELVNYSEPIGRYGNSIKRHWFRAENWGNPIDSDRAQAVFVDLKAAGIVK